MTKGLVTIFGGSGFVGRYTARALVEKGYRVRVACRRPNDAPDVKLAGAPGWVDMVQANIRNKESVLRALDGATHVVNLVGILFESGKQSFPDTQQIGAINVAEAAAECGVTRLVHVSAIGANADSKSEYFRTKAGAETGIREHIPGAVILRPSLVFGPEDQFFNRFAAMCNFTPALPAIGGGKTKVQPVYAGDLADAIANAVDMPSADGQTYEIGGPSVYSMKEIYAFITKTIDKPRFALPLPFFVMKPVGYLIGGTFRLINMMFGNLFGGPPLTGEQVEMLKSDNIVAEDMPGLVELGIASPESIEAIVPSYLWRFRTYGEFHEPKEASEG